jgi:hypothetical protein
MSNQTTQLANGQIHMSDHITVELIAPDGWPNNRTDPDAVAEEAPRIRVVWPPHTTVCTPASYPAVAATITRLISESAIALARWKAHGR